MRVSLSLQQPVASAVRPDPIETTDLPCPDAASLEQALQWLRLGAVSDLLDWAAELASTQPEYRAFAERVARMAARGDLSGLAQCLRPAAGRG